MSSKAQPQPTPSLPSSISADDGRDFKVSASADDLLNWLETLPEGDVKEMEKRRLLETRFHAIAPAPRPAGRPTRLHVAAAAVAHRAPLLLAELRAVRGGLARCRRFERPDVQVVRAAPYLLSAWRRYRGAVGLDRRDPPEDVVTLALLQTAVHRRGKPDIPDLVARLLAWEAGLPPETGARGIRKLTQRGRDLLKEGYF